jgi:hypothetical protein
MQAAMSAAEAAQTRAIDKALASERESYARAERVAEAKAGRATRAAGGGSEAAGVRARAAGGRVSQGA